MKTVAQYRKSSLCVVILGLSGLAVIGCQERVERDDVSVAPTRQWMTWDRPDRQPRQKATDQILTRFRFQNGSLADVINALNYCGVGVCSERMDGGNDQWYVDGEGLPVLHAEKLLQFDLHQVSVATILDSLCEQDSRYSWYQTSELIINLVPRKRSKLDIRLGDINISGTTDEIIWKLGRADTDWAWRLLSPEFGSTGAPYSSVNIKGATLGNFLNQLVVDHPGLSWHYFWSDSGDHSEAANRRFFCAVAFSDGPGPYPREVDVVYPIDRATPDKFKFSEYRMNVVRSADRNSHCLVLERRPPTTNGDHTAAERVINAQSAATITDRTQPTAHGEKVVRSQ